MKSPRRRLNQLRSLVHRQAAVQLAAAERRILDTSEHLAAIQQRSVDEAARGGSGISALLLAEEEAANGLRSLTSQRSKRETYAAEESRCRRERRQAEVLLAREVEAERRVESKREQALLDDWICRRGRRT